MKTQASIALLINDKWYALIGMAGSNLIPCGLLEKYQTELNSLNNRGFYVMYELIQKTLYLRGLTSMKENKGKMPITAIDPTKDCYQITDYGMNVMVPFTGKIRIARDFIGDCHMNTTYQKAIAFKAVYDIALEEGQVIEVKNRSWEMEQKRDALQKHRKSFENVRSGRVNDRPYEAGQRRCALKEYYKSANSLEKVLYAFSLDMDLE